LQCRASGIQLCLRLSDLLAGELTLTLGCARGHQVALSASAVQVCRSGAHFFRTSTADYLV
jgi:hypothetical protein